MQEEKIEKKAEKQSWVKIKPDELERIIIDLAGQEMSPAKIGLVLRDKYGIPKAKLLGKKITQILKEKNIRHITEKDIVTKKIETIKGHMKKHKHDYTAKKSLEKKLWFQHRLTNVNIQ